MRKIGALGERFLPDLLRLRMLYIQEISLKKLFCALLLAASLPCMAANGAAANATANSTAAVKIGYVQIDRLMQSPASLAVGEKLQKDFTPRTNELKRLKKQLDDKEAALDKDMLTLTEPLRQTRSKEISELRLEYQQRQRELAEDFELRKREERARLQDRINKAVAAVSQAEGYDLIFYGNAAYAGPKADITEKVIQAIK
jgi:outer membrane protein